MNAEHPLFILYTSGSTGKPKGVQHSTGGYLLHAALTTKWTFDLKPDDVFWCTADIGWVTGHTYITYGPLALGGTEVVFEGIPTYPDAGRFWQTIAKPKDIRFGDNLPKTRSGKIMRRLLRSIAKGEAITQDTSTLENPAILEQLGQAF